MKKPIPRLYVAGEISSIYGHLYLEAGNITECLVAGKIAGQNVTAEEAWGVTLEFSSERSESAAMTG